MWVKFHDSTIDSLKIKLLAFHSQNNINECLGIYVRLALHCGENIRFDFSVYDREAMMLICDTDDTSIIDHLITSGILFYEGEKVFFCDAKKCEGSIVFARNQKKHRKGLKDKKGLFSDDDKDEGACLPRLKLSEHELSFIEDTF